MQENIKRLFKDCFAHLGEVACYKSKDKSYIVQVLKQQPDKLYEIGEGQFVGQMLFLEINVFDVLRPMVGDIFVIDGRKYKVYSPPLRDMEYKMYSTWREGCLTLRLMKILRELFTTLMLTKPK